MAKVKAEPMTDEERQGLKSWYCQNDGSELDHKLAGDPTGRLRCPTCGRSWWAQLPPSAAEVEERTAAIAADKKRVDEAHAAAQKPRR